MRVSCLMVTRPERRARMVQAVEAWSRQTHADRELIVVLDAGPPAARRAALDVISSFGGAVRAIAPSGRLTLGALRNLAVAHSSGDALCIWDDDDLHHPQRITRQLAAMTQAGAAATVLQDVMLYREAARVLHWTNWAATPAGGLPGTLLCRAADMPAYAELGDIARLGEDLDLLLRLRASRPVLLQAMEPHLYVYVTHDANTWHPEHHAALAADLSISRALLVRREAAVREGLRPFALEGVCVAGPNGAAFTL